MLYSASIKEKSKDLKLRLSKHGLIVYENNLGRIFIVAINPPILSISYPDITLHDIIYDKNKLDYEDAFCNF